MPRGRRSARLDLLGLRLERLLVGLQPLGLHFHRAGIIPFNELFAFPPNDPYPGSDTLRITPVAPDGADPRISKTPPLHGTQTHSWCQTASRRRPPHPAIVRRGFSTYGRVQRRSR